jgi:hypothetical protein
MAGRQIRWASVGRIAAIAAAALAGIASLPALLGGDAPPPVPADVGLAPPPTTNPNPTAAPPPPMIAATPPSKPPRPARRESAKFGHPEPASGDRRRDHDDRGRDHSGKGRAGAQAVVESPPVPTVVAAPPVYSSPSPSSGGEFQIEP